MKLTFDIPEAINGNFEIKKVTTDNVSSTKEPLDTYTILYHNDKPIMQDPTKEYREHQPLWDNATGHVLIGGLGIGFVNQKLMDNPNVTSVTIVEIEQDVVDLVWEHCAKDDRFTLIIDDIETWDIPSDSSWDIAWFDTWDTNNTLTMKEYNDLMIEKYSSYCDEIGIWT